MITVQVWDKSNVSLIDSAIQKSDLGINPQIDGQIIRIHVPIRTNDDVVFSLFESPRAKVAHEYRLKTGHYYYTDVTKPHAVRNMSDIDRIHLVVDCYANDSLRTLIA